MVSELWLFGIMIRSIWSWLVHKWFPLQDSRYWRFTDLTLDTGYPKDISKGFSGIPSDVDAAFVWSGNGKIYFMKVEDLFLLFLSLWPLLNGHRLGLSVGFKARIASVESFFKVAFPPPRAQTTGDSTPLKDPP